MYKKILFTAAMAATLGACGYVDKYESQVSEWEPVYCYKSLAATQCYREPKHSDALRLVNYYGPHPSRYDMPEPRPEPTLKAPAAIDYWVKDAEPIPRPMPHGDLADRPWLTAEGRAESQTLQETTALQASESGTRAFLRRIDENAAKPVSAPETLPAPATASGN